MKLNEALEVLEVFSSAQQQAAPKNPEAIREIKKREATIKDSMTDAAIAILAKSLLENQIQFNASEVRPSESRRKAVNAVKNIFGSAAGGKEVDRAVQMLKAAIKKELGALR
jgi:predicted RNA binding protein with dsRBD fold (UPF0201 family)